MADLDISHMRKSYKDSDNIFDVKDLASLDPFQQFNKWFDEACKNDGIHEANDMALATSTREGAPSVRVVQLKRYDENGFQFYTNFESRKASQLDSNPQASLMFYWAPLNRSIRIEGSAERLSEKESTDYFITRPKASQIGAHVSHQSAVVKDRKEIDDLYVQIEQEFADVLQLPKPCNWGGYRVIPHMFEFWQGQTNRLHDRIVFRKISPGEKLDSDKIHQGLNGWAYERLSP